MYYADETTHQPPTTTTNPFAHLAPRPALSLGSMKISNNVNCLHFFQCVDVHLYMYHHAWKAEKAKNQKRYLGANYFCPLTVCAIRTTDIRAPCQIRTFSIQK
jgi:hypothetical protein